MARHRCLENPPDAQGIDSDICAQTDLMFETGGLVTEVVITQAKMDAANVCRSNDAMRLCGTEPGTPRFCHLFEVDGSGLASVPEVSETRRSGFCLSTLSGWVGLRRRRFWTVQ